MEDGNVTGNEDTEKIQTFLERVNERQRYLDRHVVKCHQASAIHFLLDSLTKYSYGFLADDMGLGKTATAVLILLYLILTQGIKVVVICPPSVLNVWTATFKYWVDVDLTNPTKCDTGEKHARATVTSFVRNGSFLAHTLIMTPQTFLKQSCILEEIRENLLVIVDEVHEAVRTQQTEAHSALLRFSPKFYLFLSGTPLVNQLGDIYSLTCALSANANNKENILGGKKNFTKSVSEISSHIDKALNVCTTQQDRKKSCNAASNNLKAIQSALALIMVRRRFLAIEGSDLPIPKRINIIWSMTQSQQCLYNVLDQQQGFAAVATARHITDFGCTHVSDIHSDENLSSILHNSPSFQFIEAILKDTLIMHSKIVIVAERTTLLKWLLTLCSSIHMPANMLHGNTEIESRQCMVDTFNITTGAFCLLLSKKAGGVGISLTAASTIIIMDIAYNPSDDDQAVSRIFRIGQNKICRVVKMIGSELDNLNYQVQPYFTNFYLTHMVILANKKIASSVSSQKD